MSIGDKFVAITVANPLHTQLISWMVFSMVPHQVNKVLYAPDSIHYMDGVDKVKSLSVEMAFKVDENFENVVKAWSFVINEVTGHGTKSDIMTVGTFLRYTDCDHYFLSSALRCMNTQAEESSH